MTLDLNKIKAILAAKQASLSQPTLQPTSQETNYASYASSVTLPNQPNLSKAIETLSTQKQAKEEALSSNNKKLDELKAKLDKLKGLNSLAGKSLPTSEANLIQPTGMNGAKIAYNKEQQEFIDLASSGKSCVLIGAAGTGKTTCTQGAINALINSGKLTPIKDNYSHKFIRQGSLNILVVAFTRRAVNNSKKVQSEELKDNCITVHKTLEYQPNYFEIFNSDGTITKTMRFEPNRTVHNPLPNIHTVIVEEASMLSLDLAIELKAALPSNVQWIFIGDINQLPPVFGPAILGFKMQELPIVELTQVYRQALESPIIRLAHRILSGEPIPAEHYSSPTWDIPNKLKIHAWKNKISPEDACRTLAAFFKQAIDKREYDPEEDMILIPYNKGCGTTELNKHIANHLARLRQAITYEVVAGYTKHYLSAGDKVLYDKEDAVITKITPSDKYLGVKPQPASTTLDYWGHNSGGEESVTLTDEDLGINVDIDAILELASSSNSEERTNQASHEIELYLADSERYITITKSAEVNSLTHAYALTVHKSQGSEWRKVYLCLHHSHATMLQRELLYTAVTRAKEELYCICEPDSFTKGILTQRIKGNSLAEKAEYFKGKYIE